MLLALHILLVFSTVLRVLCRQNLTPITRLAWFVVLVLLPVAGVVIYFLFGEANLDKTTTQKHKQTFNHLRLKFPAFFNQSNHLDGVIEAQYQTAFQYAMSINGFKLTTGNSAKLMLDATQARASLIADIDAATEQVHVLYYIWLNDHTGLNVAQALIRAAQRGVACKAMADGLGSRAFIKSATWTQMKDAGVNVCVALPFHHIFKTIIKSRLDLRNHRKITVIDGRITYCGSQNCADPEFKVKPKYAPWVDILLRFEGPVVAQNQLLFVSDWLVNHQSESLEDFDITPGLPKQGFPALVWGDGPTERSAATPQMFACLFNQAKHSITISTPYFVPNEPVIKALTAAAYRGVETKIIFPARNDSWVVGAASRSYYSELLSAGVGIYEFEGGLLHAKTLTIDGVITLIGSSNMDLRSFDLNYENNILLHDKDITSQVQARQQQYIDSAYEVSLSQVESWPLKTRMWHNVIATIGPVL